ncbi:MAG TPA: YkvA family protein [Acidimicrobiia bacterium]|nr:YkvA family protein [Acidimicrobiia bacterium]
MSMLKNPEDLLRLVQKAQRKSFKSGPLAELVAELKAVLRLIRAYAKGDYRDVSNESMAIIVGAVLYVVSPVDLIPDFLPMGLLDDATVLAFALRMVKEEIETFLEREERGAK